MLMRRLRSGIAAEDGVGLVEVLVAIGLMSVIGGIVMITLVRGMRISAATQTRFDALADLQKTVDRMTGPMRGAAPVNFGLSNATTAVFEVWDSSFTNKFRYTYTYCPTQKRIHMRRRPAADAYSAIDCATTTERVLIDRVTNGNPADAGYVPVFGYRQGDGTTAATAQTNVFQINVTVRRSLSEQANPIRVDTRVRLRNAR